MKINEDFFEYLFFFVGLKKAEIKTRRFIIFEKK